MGSEPPLLVAAVGNHWMQDLGFGTHVLRRLVRRPLPAGVVLRDLHFGAVSAAQQLAGGSWARAVLVSGTARGRPPGTLAIGPAPDERLSDELIQAHVVDAVSGIVAVDALLAIGRWSGALPPDVVLVEAEPVVDGWGEALSPECEALVDPAVDGVLAALGVGR